MRVGIVGLPNVGKSTLFNILLDRIKAESSNFPFTTIEPNIGVVPVPDRRLDQLARVVERVQGVLPPKVPASIKVVDIAGLIAGAHKGEGLGNKFLSHIREVDVLIEVVRVFEDNQVVKTGQEPSEDIETIRTEFALKDIETLENKLQSLAKLRYEKQTPFKIATIKKALKQLSDSGQLFLDRFTEEEGVVLKELYLLSAKPIIYLFNLSESQLADKELKEQLDRLSGGRDYILSCLKSEKELIGLSPEEKKEYLSFLNQDESAVDRLIRLAYRRLGLISFFTAGVKEVRAWPIKKGTLAPQAAAVIHTDFEKYFVKAKIVSFADFVKYQGFNQAQNQGKLSLVGRDYQVEDGDVIEFVINKGR